MAGITLHSIEHTRIYSPSLPLKKNFFLKLLLAFQIIFSKLFIVYKTSCICCDYDIFYTLSVDTLSDTVCNIDDSTMCIVIIRRS